MAQTTAILPKIMVSPWSFPSGYLHPAAAKPKRTTSVLCSASCMALSKRVEPCPWYGPARGLPPPGSLTPHPLQAPLHHPQLSLLRDRPLPGSAPFAGRLFPLVEMDPLLPLEACVLLPSHPPSVSSAHPQYTPSPRDVPLYTSYYPICYMLHLFTLSPLFPIRCQLLQAWDFWLCSTECPGPQSVPTHSKGSTDR